MPFYTIKAWHRHLTTYLQQSPTALFTERARQNKGYFSIPAPIIARASILVEDLAKNKKIRAYFTTLTTEFDTMFTRKKKKETVCVTTPIVQNGH